MYPLLTDFYAWYEQENLKQQIINKQAGPDDGEQSSGVAMSEFDGALLEIPAINLSIPVQEGTTPELLAVTPGRYIESALPGEGNTAIAGHRTMYGGPFRNLTDLKPGDIIILSCQELVFEYRVEELYSVENDDWSVIAPCGYAALTLTTCHQDGSSVRQIIRARMLNKR
ncbi:hypothetical protein ASZ90_017204 [hydrocarbon metagenome]|uniref:Uncharacterized protein n=1 Tax=hydrocarbon metagenome TaxID=938273 RepID=A0A0W8EA37_9ZZZZ